MLNRIVHKTIKFFSKKKPSTTRSDFYLNRLYFKRIIFFHSSFKKKVQENEVLSTMAVLQPLGIKLGSSIKQVLAIMGQASFIYNNHNPLQNHQAFIFRKVVNDLSLLVQVQFYNDRLFFIGIDATKTLNNAGDKIDILNTVVQKYLKKPFTLGDEYPIIQDPDGNFVIINDDVYFSICYLENCNKQAEEYLQLLSENPLKEKKEKKDKESLFYTF